MFSNTLNDVKVQSQLHFLAKNEDLADMEKNDTFRALRKQNIFFEAMGNSKKSFNALALTKNNAQLRRQKP